MKTSVLACAVTAGMFSLAAPVAAANIIVNGDFETGVLSPWFDGTDFGGTPWAITGLDAQTGTYSATNIGNREIRQNFAGVAGSSITVASLWIRHPDFVDYAPAAITYFYDDMTSNEFLVESTDSQWEKFNILAQLNKSKTLIGFSVYGYTDIGVNRTFIDNIVIDTTPAAIPEPASWAMLIAGFGLVGGAVRRRRRRAMTG
jgi:hypothetical protein